MPHRSNVEQFNNWYSKFIKEFHGLKIPNSWFDTVENNHDELRDKLGGVNRHFKIELESTDVSCKWEDIKAEATEIYYTIPDYFAQYNFPLLHLLRPVVPTGDQAGMKFGKHMTTWMDRAKVNLEKKEKVSVLMSKLGGVWAKSKSKKDTLWVNFTTKPEAFCLIGHYGPDNGSCFRQGAQNQLHKYRIGSHPNSLVILVSKKKVDEQVNPETMLARMWAFTNKEINTFHVLNQYILAEYQPHSNIFIAVEKALEQLWEVDSEKIGKISNYVKIIDAFQNSGSGLTIFNKDKIKEIKAIETVSVNKKGLEEVIKCQFCGVTSIKDPSKVIDGMYGCHDCAAKAQKCQYLDAYTFKPLHKAINKDGKPIEVSDAALKEFFLCSKTKHYHHSSNVVMFDGSYVSVFWLKEQGMKQCPYCSQYEKPEAFKINEELFEDQPVCSRCQTVTSKIDESVLNGNVWSNEEEWVLA